MHRNHCRRVAVLFVLGVSACGGIEDTSQEQVYEGTTSGQFTQVTNHGNGFSCSASFNGQLYAKIRLKSDGAGHADIVVTGTPFKIVGDTLYCRLPATPNVTSIWGTTEITGPSNNLHLSSSHTETTAQSTSNETLAFTGAMTSNAVTGTTVFHRQSQNTVIDCQPDGHGGQECKPPRNVTVQTDWTVNISVPRP